MSQRTKVEQGEIMDMTAIGSARGWALEIAIRWMGDKAGRMAQ